MKAILTYCSILLSIQLSFAHSLFPQLTNEQKQKIHEFVKPIFLNSFMYINRLTDPNTYSDNAYVVQLRINGLLYFETFGLPDIPYFTEFIRYIIGITSSKGLRIEMD